MRRNRNTSDGFSGILDNSQLSGNGRRPGMPDAGFLDNLFTRGQFPSVVKEFVHPGTEPGELLMRCVFKDMREANAAVLWLNKCEEFGLDQQKKLLLYKLAATASIKGERIKILLQAVTGIVAPSLFGKDGKRDEGK